MKDAKRLRTKIKLLICLFTLTFPIFQSYGNVANWEIYYPPGDHFQIHYIPPGSGYPLYEVTLDQVEDWGVIMEDVRNRVLQFNFDDPERNERTRIGIEDLGINAKGGISHGHGQMAFDPYYLGVPDVNVGRSASYIEQLAVAVHEYLHVIQYMYPGDEGPDWVTEGQARMLQDKIYPLVDTGDDLDQSGYLGEVNGYLLNPIRNLFEGSYDAALFWTYVTEQLGQIQSEPEVGVDALYEFWEAAQSVGGCNDAFYVFDKMLERLGFSFLNLEAVFKSFVTANFAKDLDWGLEQNYYRYTDEIQPPRPYMPVRLEIDKVLPYGAVETDFDFLPFSWAPKYYRVKPAVRGSNSPITVEVNQVTNEELYFSLLKVNNNQLIDHYTLSNHNHYDLTVVVNPGDELILIVSTLGMSNPDPVQYRYSFSSGGSDLLVNILSPTSLQDNLYAVVGPHYDPGKFLIVTEVMSNWDPVPNIQKEDFIVEVGQSSANVLTCTDVFGHYYLEVQAPTQSSSGYQNLTVRYAGAMDQENMAILYYLRVTNNMLVLDKSGSMSVNEKMDAAQAAARLFVNSYYNITQVGLASFNQDAVLLEHLKAVELHRDTLLTKIDVVNAGGFTSVGDGLFVAQNDLYSYSNGSFADRNIIILTDGRENEPRFIEDIKHLIQGNYTKVFAILLGIDSEAAALQELAYQTGGAVYFAFDPASGTLSSDLADIYRLIAEQTTQDQRVFSSKEVLNTTLWTIDEPFHLDSADRASIVFNYRADSQIVGQPVVLRTPDGKDITATFTSGKQGLQKYYGHYVWNLNQPMSGLYHIIVGESSGFIEYFAEAAVSNPLSINMHFPLPDRRSIKHPSLRVTGCEFPILVSLSDDAPITGATVKAEVMTGTSYTDTETWDLWLYDDGEHGDGLINDGVYGNWFTRTMKSGSYVVTVEAQGISPMLGGHFTRQTSEAFHLIPDTDQDKDGLPDGWEQRYGMNTTKTSGNDGPNGDNDLDNLLNIDELKYGTNPIKPDTDNGGENDFSEVTFLRDPYFTFDDELYAPSFHLIAGNQNVTIKYQARRDDETFKLYRASQNQPVFTLISDTLTGTNTSYVDLGLTNGLEYYYKMVAVTGRGAESDFSPVLSAIPNLVATRPIGFIVINNGDKYTLSTSVVVQIIGIDPLVQEMRISQDPSFEGVSWTPIQSQVQFVLADTGPQLVYVELRDSYGNIGGDDRGAYAYDGIIVNTTATSVSTTTSSSSNWITLTPGLIISWILIIHFYSRRRRRKQIR